jgi:uncharacterized Tic20 family protein
MSEFETPPPAPSGDVSSDDRTLAMLAHLLSIVTAFVAPLVIWLVNKDKADKAFVVDQAKEALNFVITLIGLFIALSIVSMVFAIIPIIGWIIGILIWLAMMATWAGGVIFLILGGIAANKGERYRYPFIVRLIS